MVGLDVTHGALLTPAWSERFRRSGRVGTFVAELVEFFKQYHAPDLRLGRRPDPRCGRAGARSPPGPRPHRAPERRGGDGVGPLPRQDRRRPLAPHRPRAERAGRAGDRRGCVLRAPARAHRNARLMPPGLGRLAVASLGAAALARRSRRRAERRAGRDRDRGGRHRAPRLERLRAVRAAAAGRCRLPRVERLRMPARKKKRPLRPRTPSRVKKRKKKSRARAAHEHPELIGLGLAALGLFLASLLYLGFAGGIVGEKVEQGLRDFLGSAAYAAPAALVAVGGLMLFRSALVSFTPFRVGLARRVPGADDDARLQPRRLGRQPARRLDRRRSSGSTGALLVGAHCAPRRRPPALGRLVRRAPAPVRPRNAPRARCRPPLARAPGPSRSGAGGAPSSSRACARAARRRGPRLSGRHLRRAVRALAAPARPGRGDRRADDALRCAARRRGRTCCPTAPC